LLLSRLLRPVRFSVRVAVPSERQVDIGPNAWRSSRIAPVDDEALIGIAA
jgi:hypothetical protein